MNPGSAHLECYSDLPDDCKITTEEELINIILSSDEESNKLDSLSRLIKKGVDINFESSRSNYNTALHLAVLKRELKVIELLINYGADTSIENKAGETPLSLAQDQLRQYIDEILNRSTKTNNMLMRPIERQQGDVYKGLKLFVKHFVKEFDVRLLVCRDILEGGAEKAGIYSDTFAIVTSKLSGETMQGASGHLFGNTEAGASASLSALDKNDDTNENETLKMRRTLYVGQTHPDISKYLHNLGRTHFILGAPAKALKHMKFMNLEMRQVLYPGQKRHQNRVLDTVANLQPEDDLLVMLSNVVSDEDDVKSAIKLIKQYSVVILPHNDTFFSVHRLVQQDSRSKFEKQYLEVNEKFQKNEPNKLEQESVELPYSSIHKLNTDLKYEEGYFHEEQALRSSSGEKTIDQLLKFEMYDENYGEQEKTSDTELPFSLYTLSDTALALRNTSDFNEVFEKYRKLNEKRGTVLGSDSLITLNALSDLAHILHMKGEYGKALIVKRDVYENRKEILGFDHSNTLTALRDIAGTLYKQGKYDEALKCINQVCERQDGILEPSDALITLMHKAVVLDKQSEHKKAKEIYQQIHEKMTVILGADHARTLTALSSLARAHANIGEYEDALKLYTDVYDIKKEKSGSDHLDTLFAAFDRAVALSRLGRDDEAFPLYMDVHKKLEHRLGPDNETVLAIGRYMAKIIIDE